VRSACREPLRPARRARIQHEADTGLVRTTFGTSTPQHITARSTSSPFDQPAALELPHSNRTVLATTTCSRPTSTHIGARTSASHFDRHATPEPDPAIRPTQRLQRAAHQTQCASALVRSRTLRPTTRARPSTRRQRRTAEYDVQQITLVARRRSADREPLHQPRSARAITP
jgi:hypothetical protein